MPKEGFHLFLADRHRDCRRSEGRPAGPVENEWPAFCLGAISPDIFFYDLPSFALGRLGDSLHELVEQKGLAPIEHWLQNYPGKIPPDVAAWGLGFASHVLADGIWHPAINDLSASLSFCRHSRLSSLDCHRLIECEMEAYWPPQEGKQTGWYVDFLKMVNEGGQLLARASRNYREFLSSAGLQPICGEARITRCYRNQNRMLRLFANPFLRKRRDSLMDVRAGRFLASLIIPDRAVLPSGYIPEIPPGRDPFSPEFQRKGIISLNSRLSDFAERLAQYLPS